MSLEVIKNNVQALLTRDFPELHRPKQLRLYEGANGIEIKQSCSISRLTTIKPALHKLTSYFESQRCEYGSQSLIVDDKYLWSINLKLYANTLSITVFDAYTEDFIEKKIIDIGRVKTIITRLRCNIDNFWFRNAHFTKDGLIWLVWCNNERRRKYFLLLIDKEFVISQRTYFLNDQNYNDFLRTNDFLTSEMIELLRQVGAKFSEQKDFISSFVYRKACVIDNIAIVIASANSTRKNVGLYDGSIFRQLDCFVPTPGHIFIRGDGRLFMNLYKGGAYYEFV